jgi:Uma2 family endonuclease
MAGLARRSSAYLGVPPLPIVYEDMPILYEDEEEGDMGEANVHVVSDEILHVCLSAHLAGQPEYRVFSNMNCYYRKGPPHPKTGSPPYISPDTMIVRPRRSLGEDVKSYTINRDGPAPVLVAEILSERSAQQRDLTDKVKLYAKLGIAEYILVDVTGRYLAQRLVLKRLQADRTWEDEQDPDSGVTSHQLDFRIIIDTDGQLRVLDAASGKRYARPDEAQANLERLDAEARERRKAERVARAEAKARQQAEERLRTLEEELVRLRQKKRKRKGK